MSYVTDIGRYAIQFAQEAKCHAGQDDTAARWCLAQALRTQRDVRKHDSDSLTDHVMLEKIASAIHAARVALK